MAVCAAIVGKDAHFKEEDFEFELSIRKGSSPSIYKETEFKLKQPLQNSPKFFTCVNPEEELTLQYKVLSSLDIVEEKLNPANKLPNNELFLGMLYALENYKLYGYVTNTKIIFIIVVDSMNMSLRENEIKSMFKKIHSEYADMVSNPFYIPGTPIQSKNFDNSIKSIITGTV